MHPKDLIDLIDLKDLFINLVQRVRDAKLQLSVYHVINVWINFRVTANYSDLAGSGIYLPLENELGFCMYM